MTRPIKFRAWDERNKIMHYNFQFFTSGDEGNDWICFSSDKEPLDTGTAPHGIIFKNPYFRQQIHIMQFTGLYDKNGKEIYEGDIVLCGTYKSVVEDAMQDYEFYSGAYNKEVIGNIYENKELLK